MGLPHAALIAATLLALVHPALAEDRIVTETDFIVTTQDADGTITSTSSAIVPLVAGACYEWQVKLAKAKLPVDVTEHFILPGAPSDWGSTDTSNLAEDGKSITTTLQITPKQGWIWHSWCVTDGDPEGPHQIVVTSGSQELARFDFVTKSAHLGNTKSKTK